MVGMAGIEPTSYAPKAYVLPLYDIPILENHDEKNHHNDDENDCCKVHTISLPTFFLWYTWRDSNPRPRSCKNPALAAELHVHGVGLPPTRSYLDLGSDENRCTDWLWEEDSNP